MARNLLIAAAWLVLLGSFTPSLSQDYIIGEGDLLRITVYDHPDLGTVARISGDGAILFPLIGSVKVAGLTLSQAAKKIASELAEGYIVSPQVTMFIEEYRSQKVMVMGQVNRPGLYELKGFTTFIEVLSKAGDLNKDAGDKAVIKRRGEGPDRPEKVITINLRRLVEMGDTSQDVPIFDGDSIYISKAGVYFVSGEVKKPDSYKYEEGLTVLKAVTTAGGFSDKASTGRVKIIRKVKGKEEVLEKVSLDEIVFPDDIIVVPESFF
ncbi:MAG: SLBB domain-containing protein [Nitrospiraceae bacterium]|nr:SLBB domain-containing protein [Nitrospiraceae bacterium]